MCAPARRQHDGSQTAQQCMALHNLHIAALACHALTRTMRTLSITTLLVV